MAERWLDEYRDEIVKLRAEERYTQAQIIRHLKAVHDITVPRSTLSQYLKELPEAAEKPVAGEITVSPEEEHFLEQKEVYDIIMQALADLYDYQADLLARMGVIEDASAERHKEMIEALERTEKSQPANADMRVISKEELRGIFFKAAFLAALAWGAVAFAVLLLT